MSNLSRKNEIGQITSATEVSTKTATKDGSSTGQPSHKPLFHQSVRYEHSQKDLNGEITSATRRFFAWPMDIIENGRRVSITVGRNYMAGIISGYQYAVDMYILSGKADYLNWYAGKEVEDAFKKPHELDTDPDHITALVTAQKNPGR